MPQRGFGLFLLVFVLISLILTCVMAGVFGVQFAFAASEKHFKVVPVTIVSPFKIYSFF